MLPFVRIAEQTPPIGVLAALLASGLSALIACFTIRPLAVSSTFAKPKVDPLPVHVVLVIDEAYRTFRSRDRGAWVEDLQTLDIGPSLAVLTEDCFRAHFREIETLEERSAAPSSGNRTYVVTPRVDRFDNEFAYFSSRRKFLLDLSADVHGPSGRQVARAVPGGYAVTFASGGVATSEVLMGRKLTEAVEGALRMLVVNVRSAIELDLGASP